MPEMNGTKTSAVPSTLAEARELMLQCVMRENAEHYRLGCLYNQVVDKGLAGACTEVSARRYFAPWIKTFSMSTLNLYGMVAREFPEEICRKYGMLPLRLLMAYARKFGLSLVGQDPGHLIIRVPQENGSVLCKTFAMCTREDLGWALSGRGGARGSDEGKNRGPPPRADLHLLQILRDGMQKRLPENTAARLRARVLEGRLQITLKHASASELELLMAAIAENRAAVQQAPSEGDLPQPAHAHAGLERLSVRE